MLRLACLSLMGLALPLLAPATQAAAKPGKVDVQACLVRPANAPDANAKGRVRLRMKTKQDQMETRLDIRVIGVDEGAGHQLFIEDAPGSLNFDLVGSLQVTDKDLGWVADTTKGGVLPGAAESGDDLVGRRIEVRIDNSVVLHGMVPSLDASKKPVKQKLQLAPADAEDPASDMTARLMLRSKAAKGQFRFKLKAQKVPFGGGDFRVFIETAAGSGSFTDAGALEQKGSSSKGRFSRDCWQGESLPLGVFDLATLAGRRIQVRQMVPVPEASGKVMVQPKKPTFVVHLEGVLPTLD